MSEEVKKIKKVKPYPIDAYFERDAEKLTAKIIRLALHGCIVDLGTAVLKVADIWKMRFEVPVMHEWIHSHCKVIKTYDRFQKLETGGSVQRLAEVHFTDIDGVAKKRINSFLTAIKQRGNGLV